MARVNGPWVRPAPVGWNDAPDPQAYEQAGDPGGYDNAGTIGASRYFTNKTGWDYLNAVDWGPRWTRTDLVEFYSRSITEQNSIVGSNGAGLWVMDYSSWPNTLSQTGGFFEEYDWGGFNYVGGHQVTMPSLLAFRVRLERELTLAKSERERANPTPNMRWRGLEWENQSDRGSLVSVTLKLYEHLEPGQSVSRDRKGNETATGAISNTSVRLLNPVHDQRLGGITPGMLGYDLAAPSTLNEPGTDEASQIYARTNFNPELFTMPALGPGESGFREFPVDLNQLASFTVHGDGQADPTWDFDTYYRLGIERFTVTTAGRATSVYDFGTGLSAFTQDVSVRTKMNGHVEAWVVYQPPRYRFVYVSENAPAEDPWLRALQRTDGQGAGGPPRAVQQAMQADSLRAGTAAL